MKYIKFPFLLNLTLVMITIISLGYLLSVGKTILAPFFLAFLIAVLFLPVTNFLEQKLRFRRGFSTISAGLILLCILAGISVFFGAQLSDFRNDIPQLTQQSQQVFQQLQEWVSGTFEINIDKQFEYLDQGLNKLLSSSGTIIGFTLGIFTTGLGFLFFFFIFFLFILNYRKILNRFIIDVFPTRHKEKVVGIVREVQTMIKSYITGLCIQIVIVTTLSTIVLSIIGVKYPLLLGVLTGLINIIPYLGIATAMLIACFIAFATAAPIVCVYVIIGYLIIHAIDGNIIVPFIVGSKVKINALFSFIGIIVGEQIWGIAGMFLCIPALAIFRIIFERVEPLQPWGAVLRDAKDKPGKRKMKLSKKITLEEKD